MGTVVPAQGLFSVASAGLCARSNHARRSAKAAASKSSSLLDERLNSGRPICTASLLRSRASDELCDIQLLNAPGRGPLQTPKDTRMRRSFR